MNTSQDLKESIPVTVVIPCYRCTATLGRALSSIASQSVRPLEIIVVGDGDDESYHRQTRTIVSAFGDQLDFLRFIPLARRGGPGAARNRGWDIARGEYIAFLDADDAWHPQKLSIQYRWMKDHPAVSLCAHSSVEVTEPVSAMHLPENPPFSWISPTAQLLSNRIHTRTAMVKRAISCRFAQDRSFSEDYQLWMEIILSGHPAALLNVPLAFSFKPLFGAGGLSGNLWAMEKGEIRSYLMMARSGLLPFPMLFCVLPLSILKFFKRVLQSRLRERSSRTHA